LTKNPRNMCQQGLSWNIAITDLKRKIVDLRVRARITSHSLISSSGRLRSIFTYEVLEIVHYSCGFAHSDRLSGMKLFLREP
jgi:hypothetical protein